MSARVTRRIACAGAIALAFPRPARAKPAPALRALLATHLPPGLNPAALGRALAPGHPPAACLAQAGAPAHPTADWLAQAAAADFAAGRVVMVEGWQLSRTEAWLCAAVA